MESLLKDKLLKEISDERLRIAGDRTRVARRRSEREMRIRSAAGNALIAAGKSLRGCRDQVASASMAPVTPLKRS